MAESIDPSTEPLPPTPRAKTLALPVERRVHDGENVRIAVARLTGIDTGLAAPGREPGPPSRARATDEVPAQPVNGPVNPSGEALSVQRTPLPAAESSPLDFEASCTAIRTRLRESERYLVRELFAISDMLAAAETLFDPATPVAMPPGTRSGKFAHATAQRLGRTAPWVEKFQQLAKIDHASRALAEEQSDGSFRMLIDLAREPEVAVRIRALNARATKGGPKSSMKKLLAAEAHPLHRVAKLFSDEGAVLANVPAATALPHGMSTQFPEVAPYRTVGEVRAALRIPSALRASLPPAAAANASTSGVETEVSSRTLRLPRDGSVVDGFRILAVDVDAVVLELPRVEPLDDATTPIKPPAEKPTVTPLPRRASRGKNAASSEPASAAPSPILEPLPEGALNVVGFTCDQAELTAAIRTAGLVTPGGVTPNGEAGYLFYVRDDGTCSLYSRGAEQMVRAAIPVRDVVGQGVFAYPAGHVGSLKLDRGRRSGAIVLRGYKADADRYVVQNATSTGAVATHATLDPRLFQTLDKLLERATNPRTYIAAILREALLAAGPFVGKASASEPERALIHFLGSDAGPRDGTAYATDGIRKFVLHCDHFRGKAAQIPTRHVKQIAGFLRICGRNVVLRDAKGVTFAASEDGTRVLAWSRSSEALVEARWPPRSWDRVVLLVRREAVLRELAYIRRELDDRRSRVRLIFDQATLAIRFQVVAGGDSTSAPIGVEVVDGGPGLEPASFADDVNVESLLSLFLAMKSELVEFRRFPMDEHNGPKSMAGFRTIDDFLLDPDGKVVRGSGAIPDPANGVFQCKVMRFTPSQV